MTTRVLNQERKTGCFHPSSLSRCPKILYDSYLKESHVGTEDDARKARIFENGHSVHKRLQKNFRDSSLLIDEDVPIHDDKYEICGEIDGLLSFWGELIVLDIKSVNSRKFRSMYKPEDSHIIQVNVYMYCLGIKYGFLFYECKDDQQVHEYFLEYNPEVLLPVFKKIKFVQKCIQEETSPECKYDDKKFECRYCEYIDKFEEERS